MSRWLLAAAWAALAAATTRALAARGVVRSRVRSMRPRTRRQPVRSPRPQWLSTTIHVVATPWRLRRQRRAADALRSELPVSIDLVAVALGAGCTPFQAVDLALQWSPPRVAHVLGRIGRASALGSSFDDALREAGETTPIVRPLTDVLRTSAELGAPASSSLTRLAAETRADVRRRAEARARIVPVRLLFPLVFCILPAFALLTVVPVVADGLHIV